MHFVDTFHSHHMPRVCQYVSARVRTPPPDSIKVTALPIGASSHKLLDLSLVFFSLPSPHARTDAPHGASPSVRDPRCRNLACRPTEVRWVLLPLVLACPGVPSRKHTRSPHPLRLHPHPTAHHHRPNPFGCLFPRPDLLFPRVCHRPLFQPNLARFRV